MKLKFGVSTGLTVETKHICWWDSPWFGFSASSHETFLTAMNQLKPGHSAEVKIKGQTLFNVPSYHRKSSIKGPHHVQIYKLTLTSHQ